MPKNDTKDIARGRGRIPSINNKLIEHSINKVVASGEELTMHGVATELNVNVTTLYRHTGGLEGLRRIHAQQVSERVGVEPSTEAKAWRDWLSDLANFYRQAFLQTPDLLKYAQAALDPEFERLERVTKALVDYGFSAREAVRAHAFLVNNVVGYVHQELQTIEQSKAGATPTYSRLAEILKVGSDELPTLSGLKLDRDDLDRDANFFYFIRYAIDGIAVHNSE
ncbi:MAG: AcrR family transcriptional regulator [Arenicella sp.]|jgi:AcrR family transcriptional regulator